MNPPIIIILSIALIASAWNIGLIIRHIISERQRREREETWALYRRLRLVQLTKRLIRLDQPTDVI